MQDFRPGDRVRLGGLKMLHQYNKRYATVVAAAEGPNDKVKVEVEAEAPPSPSPGASPKVQRGVVIKVLRKNCELVALASVAPAKAGRRTPSTPRGMRAERSMSPKSSNTSPSSRGPSRGLERERERERERGAREWQSLSCANGPLLGSPLAAAGGRAAPVGPEEEMNEFRDAMAGVTATDLAMTAHRESSALKIENEGLKAKLTALQRLVHRQEAHINTGLYDASLAPKDAISQRQHLAALARERERLQKDHDADVEAQLIAREKAKQSEWKAMQHGFDEQLQGLILTYEEKLREAKAHAERAMEAELEKRVAKVRKDLEGLFHAKVAEVQKKTDELGKVHKDALGKLQREVDAGKVALNAEQEKHQAEVKDLEAARAHAVYEADRKQKVYIRTLQDDLTDARAEIMALKIEVQRGNVPRVEHQRRDVATDPPVVPPTTAALLYDDMSFKNQYVAVPPGVHNIRDLSLTAVQSVRLPAGWTALLHESLNGAGRVRTLNADCVFVSEFNTHASSVTIRQPPAEPSG